MHTHISRRGALKAAAAGAALSALPRSLFGQDSPRFQVSLSELSLCRSIEKKLLEHLDFARVAKAQFGITGIEYSGECFKEKVQDEAFLKEMNKRAADEGVRQLLIVVGSEGVIGHAEPEKRKEAVRNYHKWVDAAKALGCHSIQVDPNGQGSYNEQLQRSAEGLTELCQYGERQKINILLGCRGNLSSNPDWLLALYGKVNRPSCGTMPSFDGFGDQDRYSSVAKLIPGAKGVCAATSEFDDAGNEKAIDIPRMMKVVLEGGYRGYVGIHYKGQQLDEFAGIHASHAILKKIQSS